HAALGAAAGMIADHLGVHGAGVEGAGRRGGSWLWAAAEVALGIALELLPAMSAAEVVGFPLVCVRGSSSRGVHGHVADRVNGRRHGHAENREEFLARSGRRMARVGIVWLIHEMYPCRMPQFILWMFDAGRGEEDSPGRLATLRRSVR